VGTSGSIGNNGVKARASEGHADAVATNEVVLEAPTLPRINPFGGGPLPSADSPMWRYEELGPSSMASPEVLHQRLQMEGLRQENATEAPSANEWCVAHAC
jgi:hypothetical protein